MSVRSWFVECCDTGTDTGPSTNPVTRYEEVVGVAADYIWRGSSIDDVVGQVLDQQGSAQQGLAPSKVNDSALVNTMFRFTGGSSDAWRIPNAAIGDPGDPTVATLYTWTWRSLVAAVPVVPQGLVIKRANAAPNEGVEAVIDSNGMLIGAFDADPGGAAFFSLNDNDMNTFWHTYAMAIKPVAGTVTLSSERSTGTPAGLPGASSTPVLMTLGAGSNVAPIGRFSSLALGFDMLHFAISANPMVEDVDTREIAEKLAIEQHLVPVYAPSP